MTKICPTPSALRAPPPEGGGSRERQFDTKTVASLPPLAAGDNGFNDALYVRLHFTVPKPQYAITRTFNSLVTHHVARSVIRLIVLTAIDLNYNTLSEAREVHNVIAYRHLPPKMQTSVTQAAQPQP